MNEVEKFIDELLDERLSQRSARDTPDRVREELRREMLAEYKVYRAQYGTDENARMAIRQNYKMETTDAVQD